VPGESVPSPEENFRKRVELVPTPQIYQALQAHWIWQDQLMWSRTQLLVAVQGGAFATDKISAEQSGRWVIFFVAGLLSLALCRLAILDERDRDNAAELLNHLLVTNLPSDTKISKERKRLYWLSGGGIIRLIIGGFMILDFLIAVWLALPRH
jgi:hypothetical protein